MRNVHATVKKTGKVESYECYICKQGFRQLANTRSHFNKKHPMNKCTICNEDIAVADRTHSCTGQRQLDCEYCTSSFDSVCAVILHLNNDHSESEKQSYACDICQQQFDMRLLMEAHRQTRHFACTKCNETFDTKWKLEAHQREAHAMQSKSKMIPSH